MDTLTTATLAALLILMASMLSVELALSAAIIEIVLGVFAGNVLQVTTNAWIDFLAGFAGIVLTFLAGAEVDPSILRNKWRQAVGIGGLSFVIPFLAAGLFAYLVGHWTFRQSEVAGVALSTTSLAVVYAVLVETGLSRTDIGKIIMAATFVTDLCTVLALSALFITPNPFLVLFVVVSVGCIVAMVVLERWFFGRYGDRVIEPEIKGAFFVLFLLMWVAQLAHSQAALPAFLLGLAVAPVFQRNAEQHKRFRVVAFSFLTPFFFLKGGLSVNLFALLGAIPLLLGFFAVKIAAKFAGVLPVSLRFVRPHAMYTTLLMSTGLTFGTISSLYGLNAGIIDRAQFSVLITTVILSAVVPTFFAQRFFSPPTHPLTAAETIDVEDEEFAPG
ncbi:MAG TPA: cation:proton antiporter [Candidatus Dormibacteraeota bacterium]|nr:cation:proton antiporter [Candidatus Dormibacteraeota bacterium]